MKGFLCYLCLVSGLLVPVFAQRNDDAYSLIKNNMSVSKFVEGPVSDADIEAILLAGLSAPSARNSQPWRFVVVKSPDYVSQTINDVRIPAGNISIIVYAAGDGKTNGQVILDCGLAVSNLFLAAQALGYGSRIYTGMTGNINRGSAKARFGIPDSANAIAVVRVGRIASRYDAVTQASPRKNITEYVTFK